MKSVEEVLMDIVDLCEELRLEYVILGGIAVRVHGIPRPTYDVGDVLFTQGQLDEAYMKYWAVKLNIHQRLEQALHND